jgi:NEDD8-activating enzyme E1
VFCSLRTTFLEGKKLIKKKKKMTDAAPAPFNNNRFVDFLTVMRRASKGGLSTEFHDPGTDLNVLSNLNILVVGAGGIGCEVLHALAVSPLVHCNFVVIDLDTIDLSNLNRQFLFRTEHIHSPKAVVAANEIKKRYPQMRIEAIHDRIEHLSSDFYRSMHFILLGLDSVPARQWINSTVATLYAEDVARAGGDATQAFPIGMIDGGTEAYKGSVRRIEIGKTPCIECMMYQFPPRKGVPMCTLENVPRNATHCVLYAMEKNFKDAKPFGNKYEKPDGDNEDHINWIMNKAVERQVQFKIEGNIDFPFTQGVVKNIVPAVGFSNALVAASIVNEAIKTFTQLAPNAMPQIQYDGSCVMGVGSTTPYTLFNDDCPECSPRACAKISTGAPFSSLPQIAWNAITNFTNDSKGKKIPKRCKMTARVDLMGWTIYPIDHPAAIPSADPANKATVATAELKKLDGKLTPLAPGSVITVELTVVAKTKEEREAEQSGPSQDAADENDAHDICGKQKAYVMVLVE